MAPSRTPIDITAASLQGTNDVGLSPLSDMISPVKLQRDCLRSISTSSGRSDGRPSAAAAGTSLGRFLSDLTREIQADRTALVEMA
jgi:hypothetical protein